MNKLISLMENVENPGTFSVSGTLPSIAPGLKVKGLGTVSFPFPESQARALIELSEQAPYGRGEETIMDTTVRNVWQISSENFEMTNPQWEESLHKAVHEQIGTQLGLHGCTIEFEAYKLLIYEQDCFFTSHRDTEKMPDMFATLVINLPSEYEGGELIVDHAGHRQHYSFADKDLFHFHFVAFYADCYHEVQPVTSGYRICLIYNLAIAHRKEQPRLSQQLKHIEDIECFIQQWTQTNQETPILAYLLEHSYSEKNICLANLKNGDFAKASVLLQAAEQNNCQAFLCLVTYYRTSYGETAYYGRYSYRDDLTEDDFDEYDVDREEIYAHCFMTSTGDKIPVEKLYLEEHELLAKIPLCDGPGRDVLISEATGNEGATKDLWYHRGAVIIWPKDRDMDMITKMDIGYGVYYLKNFLQEHDVLEEDHRQKITRLADHILEHQSRYNPEDISTELIAIGNIDLLKKFIRQQVKQSSSLSRVDVHTFLQIVERFGWQHFEKDVSAYLTTKRGALQWINSILLAEEPLSDEGRSVVRRWFETLRQSALKSGLTKGQLSHVFQIAALLKIHASTDAILEFLSLQKQPLFLTKTYGPAIIDALKELKSRDYDRTFMATFVEDALQQIRRDFPSAPDKPKDWFRAGQLQCTCEFCAQVNQFLPDRTQREISFYKTLKRNMTHVESEINKSQVDLDIKIVRTPPKFQGTCKKNQKSYDKKRKLFDSAQKIVKTLELEMKSIKI